MERIEGLVIVEISATICSTLCCCRKYMVKWCMMLKLTGGDRLGRLSELPIRSGVEGFAAHASSATSSKEGSLALIFKARSWIS